MKILATALLSLVSVASIAAAPTDRLFYPENSRITLTARTEARINDAVARISEAYGLGLKADEIKFVEVKDSLMGRHYLYKQVRDGIDVRDREFIVSTNKKSGKILKIYNNLLPVPAPTPTPGSKFYTASVPLISQDRAFDIAWRDLRSNGQLLQKPTAKLFYNQDFKLVYEVEISTSSPYGHYKLIIDAANGKVLETSDAALPRMKRTTVVYRSNAVATSFSTALRTFESKKANINFGKIRADGTGVIFDPNPVVTLGRTDLEDTAEDSVFLPAYHTADLKELSVVDGVYHLSGPKVSLIDFEQPAIAPSTSASGHWDAQRKNVAFNDVMTYHHLDKNMRYIESLGFKGETAVFPKTIEVDANGVNGQDNSHYIPSSRRLAFGHGCVDDNEDTDVILHELGHAIHHHINARWNGGDTGAMGEGFGDYWAASYSYTTTGGTETNPDGDFKWDGHNKCWPGRKLNAVNMKYDPKVTYRAHARAADGEADELWSTPLFQAFMELHKNGVSRNDIDSIVLEAHFGLGSAIKMPEMATAIIRTAKALFPYKKYDEVFKRHFQKNGIVQ